MVDCADCGKEVAEKEAVKLTIDGKHHHFHFHHVTSLTQRLMTTLVLNKTFAELIAIGAGIIGIVFTLQDLADKALVMDTISAIAAIAAFFVGIEHIRYLRQHALLRRALLLTVIGILITIVIAVWHFGFTRI